MTHQHIVIIGAGPCGLGAAWQLQQHNISSFHVYESLNHVGGLSSTTVDAKGFIWDIGGHVLHTTDHSTKQFFLDLPGLAYNIQTRKAFVLVGSERVPYPIQHNRSLAPEHDSVCTKKSVQKTTIRCTSFYDWIIQEFGMELANSFFFPYNKKMWNYPLKNMSWHWADTRIAKRQEKQEGEAWGRNANFMVPTRGGIGAIWTSLKQELAPHISCSKQVISVDAKNHTVRFQDGEQVSYDYLLSTMPLPLLSSIISGVSISSALKLVSTGVYVVGLGMRGSVPENWKNAHWMYISSPQVPFFRVSVYSNYGKQYAPEGTWSLLFEVSYDGKKKIDETACIREVILHAKNLHFISEDIDIVNTFFTAAPIAYPVPTKDRDTIVEEITTALLQFDISSLGRFGAWNYEHGNMDQVVMRGMEWADDIAKKL